jgi:hypothetical protein
MVCGQKLHFFVHAFVFLANVVVRNPLQISVPMSLSYPVPFLVG